MARMLVYDRKTGREMKTLENIKATNWPYFLYINERFPPGDSVRTKKKRSKVGQRRH